MESDSGPAHAFVLKIEPDYDGEHWTHFSGHLGHVLILGQLSKEVLDMIKPVLDTLMHMGVNEFEFDERYNPPFRVNGESVEVPFWDRQKALEAMRLTAYWLEWHRRRFIMRARSLNASDPAMLQWRCLDCNQLVPMEKMHCSNHQCPSWDKLHLTTGEVTLHLVPDQSTA